MKEEEQLIQGENGLIYKAETVLRHKNRLLELSDRKARQREESKKIQKDKRRTPKSNIITPGHLVARYKQQQKNYSNYKIRKQSKKELICPTSSLMAVLRIRGNTDISPQQKKILSSFKLRKQHELVLIHFDEKITKKIKLVENFLRFGPVTRSFVRGLIVKRGYLIDDDKLMPIKSNKIVEDIFSDDRLICVDDLVSAIWNNSPLLEKINEKLPFFNKIFQS